jgi:hypothetical protein
MCKMNAIGEILVVRQGFIGAQTENNLIPLIGDLLETGGEHGFIFFVVDHYYESKIPGRIPSSYGLSIEKLEEEQPHVFYLTRTMIQLVLVMADSKSGFVTPERIPPIHTLLYQVEKDKFLRFMKEPSFVSSLFNIDINLVPQRNNAILLLFKRYLENVQKDEESDERLRLMKKLSSVLKDDYRTLKLFMDNLEAVNG